MIQRIQSLWLLLASACVFAGFKFSFYSGNKLNDPLLQQLNASSTFLLMIITIFLFKKRTLQLRLCVLGILLEGLLIFLYYRETTAFTLGTYSLTAVLHLITLLAFVLAARGIHKDSKMVKDSDRLR
jgi:hypothetical protein